MSCFIVPDDHLRVLVSAAIDAPHGRDPLTWYVPGMGTYKINFNNADEVMRMLYRANFANVLARYEGAQDLPGATADDPREHRPKYRRLGVEPIPIVVVLKALDCYEYQSSDREEWEGSQAQRFCDSLRRRMISRLPGYADAPWEFSLAEYHKACNCQAGGAHVL